LSEASAAVIQTLHSITLDNVLVVISEAAWALFVLLSSGNLMPSGDLIGQVGIGYVASGALLLGARVTIANRRIPQRIRSLWYAKLPIIRQLLWAGSLITLAQLADFLYAPTDYILIDRFISTDAIAVYAPAVQIDAGLLLLVSALAATLLPKAALAHAAGEVRTIRSYYVYGTLFSAGVILAAGSIIYVLAPSIFRLWLGDPLPQTQAILPLVLIHTILGGSSGVGRAILLGMGKVKPFAIAAIVAGVANVILSFTFVKFFNLGLNGIIYGTIAAVIGRCVLWQPWYVMRTLRREGATKPVLDTTLLATPPEPL
jgi:O-antigen/teichoic acid export membrane protein